MLQNQSFTNGFLNIQGKTQTADYRLQTGGKMQINKMQITDFFIVLYCIPIIRCWLFQIISASRSDSLHFSKSEYRSG